MSEVFIIFEKMSYPYAGEDEELIGVCSTLRKAQNLVRKRRERHSEEMEIATWSNDDVEEWVEKYPTPMAKKTHGYYSLRIERHEVK